MPIKRAQTGADWSPITSHSPEKIADPDRTSATKKRLKSIHIDFFFMFQIQREKNTLTMYIIEEETT